MLPYEIANGVDSAPWIRRTLPRVRFLYCKKRRIFLEETRVALLGIVVEEPDSVEPLNRLLHQYKDYIIGRMGLPYHKRGISIISIVLDAPGDAISSLAGKVGMLPGVTAKAVYSKIPDHTPAQPHESTD